VKLLFSLFRGHHVACSFALMSIALTSASSVSAQAVTYLTIETGHSMTVSVPGLTRIAVGDERIAGVVAIGRSQVVINGKAPGRTTVFIWSDEGRASYEVAVQGQGLDDMVPIIRVALAEPDVQVRNIGRAIIVSGTVPDNEHAARVTAILAQFSGAKTSGFDAGTGAAEEYKIINTVSVQHPFGALQRVIGALPDASNVQLNGDAKGNVIVSGEVTTRQAAERVLALVRGAAGFYLGVDGKVIDRLAVATTSQISIRVYVLEIDDTGLKDLGISLQSATISSTGQPVFGSPIFPIFENPSGSSTIAGRALTLGAFIRTTFLAPTLNAVIQTSHAKILSQPDLLTSQGVAAEFLVGGQIPYVFSTGLGQTSVVFKDYGVKLDVTPVILGSGAVDCKITPEVSQLDYADGVTISGYVLPALKTSRLQTEVVTQPGESIVMGGLLQRIETRTINKIPILGDLPILGPLFRSTQYQHSQTDVVFVMTPEVIVQ
jgi:Flp pilus assembly secretin CpaC